MRRPSRGEPIRVLVVDDSPTVREFLASVIDAEPDMIVVKAVDTAERAIQDACRLKPSLITMDVSLPGRDGIEATTTIMRRCPTPIAVVTAAPVGPNTDATFRALAAGAVDVIQKPNRKRFQDDPKAQAEFTRQLRMVASVGVVGLRLREVPAGSGSDRPRRTPAVPSRTQPAVTGLPSYARVIAIGASTGGPPAVCAVLGALRAEHAPPVVVAQHMTSSFVEGFALWLADTTGLAVKVPTNGERLLPGHVYVAPGDRHLLVGGNLQAIIDSGATVNFQRPSADVLFSSVARSAGANAIGVLLTGMGTDGAEGLRQMREAGATTIVQNEASCVVFGMPGAAIDLGAATLTAPPTTIGQMLGGVADASRLAETTLLAVPATTRRFRP